MFFFHPSPGEVKYDAIVKQGTNRERNMFTSLKDMKVGYRVVESCCCCC